MGREPDGKSPSAVGCLVIILIVVGLPLTLLLKHYAEYKKNQFLYYHGVAGIECSACNGTGEIRAQIPRPCFYCGGDGITDVQDYENPQVGPARRCYYHEIPEKWKNRGWIEWLLMNQREIEKGK